MFIVKCILTEAFSPVNNFLMFIINFYMFYNKFYTFYNKARTNCNPWHPIPSPTKKLLPCDLTVAKAAAFYCFTSNHCLHCNYSMVAYIKYLVPNFVL